LPSPPAATRPDKLHAKRYEPQETTNNDENNTDLKQLPKRHSTPT